MYSSVVLHGQQLGRQIGYPTANLSPDCLELGVKQGVYAAKVFYKSKTHVGALYFGPRLVLNETVDVLEIHILDFEHTIYDEVIQFTLEQFIRPPLQLKNLSALKNQLQVDIEQVQNFFTMNANKLRQ